MLWGGALAIGTESFNSINAVDKALDCESFRKHKGIDEATAAAINASKYLIESFHQRAGTVNCRNILYFTRLALPLHT